MRYIFCVISFYIKTKIRKLQVRQQGSISNSVSRAQYFRQYLHSIFRDMDNHLLNLETNNLRLIKRESLDVQ